MPNKVTTALYKIYEVLLLISQSILNLTPPHWLIDLIADGWWISVPELWSWYTRTQAYTNDPVSGAGIVLNMVDTTDFVVGCSVQVSSSAGTENAMITAVVVNTSITVNYLNLNHTTTNPLVTLIDTVKIIGDLTTKYKIGMPIRMTNSTVKYFYINLIPRLSSGNTLLSLNAGSDYTLTNTVISSVFYSFGYPTTFPLWFNYTPKFILGFSSPPTSFIYKFKMFYNIVDLSVRQLNDGTSNATNFEMASPLVSQNVSFGFWYSRNCICRDNTSASTTLDQAQISFSTTIISLRKNVSATGWTASGGKTANFVLTYETGQS